MTTIIGQPINRVDGPLKVSGQATYAYEHWDVGQPLYGFIVGATIGKGRITRIDTARAEQAPGVRMVMTHRNAPAQGAADLGHSLALLAAPTGAERPRDSPLRRARGAGRRHDLRAGARGGESGRRRLRRRAGALRLRGPAGPGVRPEEGQCRPRDRQCGGRFRRRVSAAPRSRSISGTRRRISSPSRWSRTPAWRCRAART